MNIKKITLRKLLTVMFLLFSLFVVGIVVVTTNILLKDEFVHYMDQVHSKEVKQVVDVAKNNIKDFGDTEEKFNEIADRYIEKGFILSIKKNEKIIFDGFKSKQIKTLKKKYKKEEKKLHQYFDTEYAVYEDSFQKKEDIYMVEVFVYRPAFLNADGYKHLDSLNQIFIYVGSITLAIAVILGFVLSKMLVKPLDDVMNKMIYIRRGEYEKSTSNHSKITEYQKLIDTFDLLNLSLHNQKQIRKNLSADVSHELRTPLTAMTLILEGILEGIEPMDSKSVQSLLEEAYRMKYLIEDIHKLEQVEATLYDLDITKVDMVEMISHILHVSESALKEKGIHVTLNLDAQYAYVDKYRMVQVISNLISNAIKYTKRNGEISISTSKEKGHYIICIKDNGVGIGKKDQERVFYRFYRSSIDAVSKESGLGIGLTISKEIVEAHNGNILLFSELHKGTEIFIVLNAK